MFLIKCKHYNLLYLDTGDMTPIEFTAQLHLREAKIIVERNILKDEGIILIDDVKSCVPKKAGEISDYGKAKYSIPYFLENGYEALIKISGHPFLIIILYKFFSIFLRFVQSNFEKRNKF